MVENFLLKQIIKLRLSASAAIANQAVTTSLAQHGININSFLLTFNEITLKYPKFLFLNVLVFIYDNKTFKIKIKGPIMSFLIKDFKKQCLDFNIDLSNLIFFLICFYRYRKTQTEYHFLISQKEFFFKKLHSLYGLLKSMKF